jgi:hypothetical protein
MSTTRFSITPPTWLVAALDGWANSIGDSRSGLINRILIEAVENAVKRGECPVFERGADITPQQKQLLENVIEVAARMGGMSTAEAIDLLLLAQRDAKQ